MIGPHMNASPTTITRRTSPTAARRTTLAGVAALLAAFAVAGTATEAEAQEIQLTGPLAGAPAVRHERLFRDGRLEIAPTVSFTLLDEYKRAILFGARAQYNITDWLGVGVWGAYGAVQITTNLTDQIDSTAQRNVPETAVNVPAKGTSFANQVAEIQWVAVPQIQVTPFRGKLAIFQKVFVDADAYIHGGLGFVGLKERGDCGGSPPQVACTNQSSFALTSRMALSPSFGLGFNFYMGNFMALGVEYRALPFSWNQGGFDTRGGNPNGNFPDNKISSADQTFKFNQMLTVSLGFSFSLSDFSFSTKPHLSE
jgi:outer membrane beta-barrel protein